jgi:hypothetical protein
MKKNGDLIMQIGEEKTISIDEFFQLSIEEEGIYEIETPQGWVEIGDLVKKNNKECFLIRTKSGIELGGSEDHYVETNDGWKNLKDLDIQDCYVKTKNGEEEIIAKEYLGVRDTFDLEVKNEDHKYYSNDIVSHNTGKTTIGKIICGNLPEVTVIWITPEIIDENHTQAFSSIKLLYKIAEFVAPTVLILEDLDLFAEDRETGGNRSRLGSLMNILDGVNTISNCVTIGMTNRLNCIESALRNRPGRFDRLIEIPCLDDDLRRKMFTDRLEDWAGYKKVIDYIVDKTNDWTGAESQEFINTLHLNFISGGKKKKKITTEMVDKSIETMQSFGVGENNKTFGFNKE